MGGRQARDHVADGRVLADGRELERRQLSQKGELPGSERTARQRPTGRQVA